MVHIHPNIDLEVKILSFIFNKFNEFFTNQKKGNEKGRFKFKAKK